MLPPVSGPECIEVLQRAGYQVRVSGAGFALLWREGEALRVPLIERIPPDDLVAILQSARIGPTRFLELLDA